jgi:hypothetical protein
MSNKLLFFILLFFSIKHVAGYPLLILALFIKTLFFKFKAKVLVLKVIVLALK